MRTDMILLDLDSTLLNDDKKISDGDIKSLWDMSNAGMYVGYVTSRTSHRIKEILNLCPCDCLALYNGAAITINRMNESKIEKYYGIDGRLAIELLDYIYHQTECEVSAYFECYSIWNGKVSSDGKEIGYYETYKAVLSECKCQRIRIYNARGIISLLENSVLHIYYEKNDILIESMDIDKGFAVKTLCSLLCIKKQNVITFGDSEYDIPMFLASGKGIAMGNASETVKQSADEIILDNNNSGVSVYLNKEYALKDHLENATLGANRCIYLFKNTIAKYKEHRVNEELLELFRKEAFNNADEIAGYIGTLSEKLLQDVGEFPVLISLARGGIMPGALCKRYYEKVYGVKISHYAISLVRGKGIDKNALNSIVARHGDRRIRFIDGWTGSGLISSELEKCCGQAFL